MPTNRFYLTRPFNGPVEAAVQYEVFGDMVTIHVHDGSLLPSVHVSKEDARLDYASRTNLKDWSPPVNADAVRYCEYVAAIT